MTKNNNTNQTFLISIAAKSRLISKSCKSLQNSLKARGTSIQALCSIRHEAELEKQILKGFLFLLDIQIPAELLAVSFDIRFIRHCYSTFSRSAAID